MGGVVALLTSNETAWSLLLALLGLAILLAVAYKAAIKRSADLGITSEISLLLSFALGALAGQGEVLLSLAAAVIVALLLQLKPVLHRWLNLIEEQELNAYLQLLVLSLVVLPQLPNRFMGPYDALNPYLLWTAVVLIAGLSLASHLAIRLFGSERGLLSIGLMGGLASSTAVTLTLSRLVHQDAELNRPALAGALGACGLMFFRLLLLVGLMSPSLFALTWPSLLGPGLCLMLAAWLAWRSPDRTTQPHPTGGEPPATKAKAYDLPSALAFGLLLATIAVAVPFTQDLLGDPGLYVVALLSGLADVDAMALSLSQSTAHGQTALRLAGLGLMLAVLANMVSKLGIAWFAGGTHFGKGLGLGYLASLLVGLVIGLSPWGFSAL